MWRTNTLRERCCPVKSDTSLVRNTSSGTHPRPKHASPLITEDRQDANHDTCGTAGSTCVPCERVVTAALLLEKGKDAGREHSDAAERRGRAVVQHHAVRNGPVLARYLRPSSLKSCPGHRSFNSEDAPSAPGQVQA